MPDGSRGKALFGRDRVRTMESICRSMLNKYVEAEDAARETTRAVEIRA